MYEVVIGKAVIKQLEKVPPTVYRRIKAALTGLSTNPRPKGYLKLKGRDAYRIRGEIIGLFTKYRTISF